MEHTKNNGKSFPERKKGKNLSSLNAIYMYLPYWPVILISTILAAAITHFCLNLRTTYYETSASIIVKDENKGFEESKITESINFFANKKVFENEIEIVRSRSTLKKVVDSLNLYYEIYEPGRFRSTELYSNAPVTIEFRNPHQLKDRLDVPFSINFFTDEITLENQVIPIGTWAATSFGEIRFEKNHPVSDTARSYYLNVYDPKTAVGKIESNLKITAASKISSLITIKYKDNIPERGEKILKEMIRTLEINSVNEKNQLIQNTLNLLDDRLAGITRTLDSSEKRLEEYRTANNAFDLSTQGKEYLENVSENDKLLTETNLKLSNFKQLESAINSGSPDNYVVPSTLDIDDPALTNLFNKLTEAELEYENLKRNSGENSPQLLTINDQIRVIKSNILKNISSQRKFLESNREELQSNISFYNAQVQSLPQQERYLLDITREQNIISTIYSFLLQKKEETALSLSSTVPDIKVIDEPESSNMPTGIPAPAIYLLGTLAGFLLPFRVLHLRERLSSRVLYRQELDQTTNIPVIAEIIKGKRAKTTVVDPYSNTLMSEQFRFLKSSLNYLGLSKYNNRILVTSSISGEGKSFLATNLALSFVQSGKKTVLVDFDLRNPTIHKKLGIVNSCGLAEYLSTDTNLGDIIQSHYNIDNFYVITAGQAGNSFTDLVVGEKSQDLITKLGEIFDVVVIDSPPVGAVADAYSLSNFCDLTLYMVRHKYTPRKILENLDENNSIYDLKNPGIVLNGITKRGFSKSPYQYGEVYKFSTYVEKDNYYQTPT
jgi:capsular exopolysaccharide synthesis family protein